MRDVEARLQRIERRDWWLWAAAIVVMLLLMVALISMALPSLSNDEHPFFGSLLERAVLALGALVLLFVLYVVNQQFVIKRLRGELANQVAEGTRLRAETESLQRMTLVDPLTGLYTEPFLRQQLAAEMARARRHAYQLNLLALNLKNFKAINQEYGRASGDMILCEFAERLKKSIRSSDIAVRVCDDEFLALLPESSPEWVPHVLARMSGMEVNSETQKIPVQFAAGWTACHPDETADQILERVRRQVTEDKQSGFSEEAIRKAQAEIRQMQNVEALARLAGKIVHDFGNLITVVKAYSEMALVRLPEADPLREYLERIHDANERANSLVRQLLTFTRTSASGTELLDVNALVRDLQRIIQRVIGGSIELVIQPGEGMGGLKLNRGQVEQLILNLVVNARDNMREGGTLTITTRAVELDESYAQSHPGARPGSYIAIMVKDSGAGTDADTLAHVFDPFFIKKERGKGLDLAAVYGIVKQSGGYVCAESQPGQGTTFTVFLPRHVPATAALGEPPRGSAATILPAGRRI